MPARVNHDPKTLKPAEKAIFVLWDGDGSMRRRGWPLLF